MKSGKMTEARDQVWTTRFSLRLFMSWTRPSRRASTNGPFLTERDIWVPSFRLLAMTGADDQATARLVATGAQAHGRLAPGRLGRHARGRLALATTMGIDRKRTR